MLIQIRMAHRRVLTSPGLAVYWETHKVELHMPAGQRMPNGVLVRLAREAKASPRIRMAARLYASGACKTKREAARVAQINPEWFTTMSNHNPETKRIADAVDGAIDDQSVEMSTTLRTIGREAIKKIRGLMYEDNPHIALKAAVDLADRSPEVSKVHKQEIVGHMSVRPDDAKLLAESLVAAAEARRLYTERVKDGFSRIEVEVALAPVPKHILGREAQADAQASTETHAEEHEAGDGPVGQKAVSAS